MGISISKQTTISETVNNIVNETVNETVNSFKTHASSNQNMKIGCTTQQMDIASKSYQARYETWQKYGAKGPEPKNDDCSFSNIDQSSIVTLRSDTAAKNEMSTNIDDKLKTIAQNYDTLEKMKGIAEYSHTEKEAIVKIANNVLNKVYNKTLNETINIAVADQNLEITGGNVSNVKQSSVVNLISSAIINSIITFPSFNTYSFNCVYTWWF